MDTKMPWWLPALAALFFAGAFAALGWTARGLVADAAIANLNAVSAKVEKTRAEDAARRLGEAQQRGDQLALQVNELSNTLTLFAEEKNHEIARLATGRRCLDAGLVRVLNRSPDEQPGHLPEATGQPVRTAAATTADSDDGAFATDADIAGWANTCRTRYDTCRGQLNAIGQFYGEPQDAR